MITYLKTLLFELREQKEVKRRFYTHEGFRSRDEALRQAYRNINPYRICRRFLEEKGEKNPHQYGETPLTTMAKIAAECEIHSGDTVLEMGAGRGRAALFLAEFIGCRVLAYEQIPLFAEKMVPSKNLRMISEDMFSAPFSEASVIFLYGTMMKEAQIEVLCKKFPQEAKIITVSYPLSDYSDHYLVKKVFSGRFPWGKTDLFWNQKII